MSNNQQTTSMVELQKIADLMKEKISGEFVPINLVDDESLPEDDMNTTPSITMIAIG